MVHPDDHALWALFHRITVLLGGYFHTRFGSFFGVLGFIFGGQTGIDELQATIVQHPLDHQSSLLPFKKVCCILIWLKRADGPARNSWKNCNFFVREVSTVSQEVQVAISAHVTLVVTASRNGNPFDWAGFLLLKD